MLTLEGTQLGNYDVIRRIRVGGMGAVYEGRQRTAFGRRVAIKVILGSYASDREMRRRFAREARTIAQLHHPHILPLIEFGAEQGILYLVMPFIEGGTLTGYLRRELPAMILMTWKSSRCTSTRRFHLPVIVMLPSQPNWEMWYAKLCQNGRRNALPVWQRCARRSWLLWMGRYWLPVVATISWKWMSFYPHLLPVAFRRLYHR